jgi:hypothetical protein
VDFGRLADELTAERWFNLKLLHRCGCASVDVVEQSAEKSPHLVKECAA